MSRDEQAIEKEIQAKGLNAPRLTQQHIDEQIIAEYSFRASDAVKGLPVSERADRALGCLTMDPTIVKELLAKNSADIQAIVETIGVGTLLRLAPHFMAIVTTLQATPPQKG